MPSFDSNHSTYLPFRRPIFSGQQLSTLRVDCEVKPAQNEIESTSLEQKLITTAYLSYYLTNYLSLLESLSCVPCMTVTSQVMTVHACWQSPVCWQYETTLQASEAATEDNAVAWQSTKKSTRGQKSHSETNKLSSWRHPTLAKLELCTFSHVQCHCPYLSKATAGATTWS